MNILVSIFTFLMSTHVLFAQDSLLASNRAIPVIESSLADSPIPPTYLSPSEFTYAGFQHQFYH